jgi:hypothetical protein
VLWGKEVFDRSHLAAIREIVVLSATKTSVDGGKDVFWRALLFRVMKDGSSSITVIFAEAVGMPLEGQ